MSKNTSNVDDQLNILSVEELNKSLELNYVPIFLPGKAITILWATFCFVFSLVSFVKLNNPVLGSAAGIFMMLAIFGSPVGMTLDKASQEKYKEWVNKQL